MKNQLRRELAIAIVLLFVGASFIPAIMADETENQRSLFPWSYVHQMFHNQ